MAYQAADIQEVTHGSGSGLSGCEVHALILSSADSAVTRAQAMIADYSPLGSASCALFARKFREEDALTYLSVAEGFLQRPPALEPIRKANRL